jgi:lipoprotein-releasing system ATP-binding protein
VLKGVNLSVRSGERLAIIGASVRQDDVAADPRRTRPADHGRREIAGSDIHALEEKARGELRNRTLGFIYQFHHLLPEFSALGKRGDAAARSARAAHEAENTARAILQRVGLGERLVTVRTNCRAANASAPPWRARSSPIPRIVLADEPTGNLDGANAEAVFALMLELNRELATSLIVVTHDRRLAARMDRILELDRGNLVERS